MNLPPGARIQADGSIILTNRGIPPDCDVPGYEVDPTDPYRWNLLYVPCIHREHDRPFRCPSGRIGKADYCKLLQIKTTRNLCFHCPKQEAS